MVEGTVTLLVGGSDAKLRKASKAPTEQRLKANKTRGLKRPDLEVGFVCMMIFPNIGWKGLAAWAPAIGSEAVRRMDAFIFKSAPPFEAWPKIYSTRAFAAGMVCSRTAEQRVAISV
jgi:hypothetical protein